MTVLRLNRAISLTLLLLGISLPTFGQSISISDVTVREGNSGTTNAVFQLSLASATLLPVTVSYATADGTAIAGGDYIATNGIVTFLAGQTSQTITVAVN